MPDLIDPHPCASDNPTLMHHQFGTASGLGLFPLTFDWSQIAYIGSPLVVPFWAAVNIITGLVLVMWIAAPIMCEYRSHLDCNSRLTIP